jgi:hypothetical protein
MRKAVKRNTVNSRLRAFNSFADLFTGASLKSGWKEVAGSWSYSSSKLTSVSNGTLVIPMSKSNVTVSATIPSNQTGTGVVFWQQDANNYWAAYGYSSNYNISSCNNGSCSGTEQFTNTRSCSCYTTYGTCSSTVVNNYGTCNLGTNYGTCQYTTSYGTCSSTVTNNYGTCSSTTSYGICSYTAGTTSYNYFSVRKTSDDCSFYANTVQFCAGGTCNGNPATGCSPQATWACCKTTTTSAGSYNYAGCSYNGQLVATGTSWNYGGCSSNGQQVYLGQSTSWNYAGCSSNGQVVATGSSWNYGGCSSNGQVVAIGQSWNYPGCSSNGQQVYLGQSTVWNYGGCSSNGQVVSTGSASTCNSGACNGTEQFTDTRSCSCTIGTNRYIRVIKVLNGTRTTVGDISVPATPLIITAITSGNSVTVSGSTGSQTFTNNDGTTYKNFGTIKDDGGANSGSFITQFTALAS